MPKVTAEQRKAALRKRTEINVKTKDSGNFARVIDLEGEEVQWFKPLKGNIKIDIIPYVVKTKNHPQKTAEGYLDYLLDVWVHQRVGPGKGSYLCPARNFGKACPICEEQEMLKQNPDADEDEIKALSPKRRAFYNVVDLNHEDTGVQLWEVSHFLFEKELLEEAESDSAGIVTFSDLEEGKTIKCRGSEKSMGGGKPFLEYKSFSFEDRAPYGEDMLEESFSLDKYMVIPTYDELRLAHLGMEEDDVDEEEEKAPATTKRERPARAKKEVEEDDGVPPFDVDEEEKPKRERPKRTRPVAENKCPKGYVYAVECEKHEECAECDVWEACADAQDVLLATGEIT